MAGQKAQHIRNRGFDSQYYRDMIVALVREHQPVSREDIDKLLLDKLPEVLSQARQGAAAGKQFWGCSRFGQTKCRGTREPG